MVGWRVSMSFVERISVAQKETRERGGSQAGPILTYAGVGEAVARRWG